MKYKKILLSYSNMTNRFKDAGYLCHYTKINSCLSILQTKSLWLTRKRDTYDVIEKMFSNRSSVKRFSSDRDNYEFMNSELVRYTEERCRTLYNNVLQTSFCQTTNVDYSHRFYLDDYCFMHTRMWEQYGENYGGFGLIFSKECLQRENPSIFFSSVNYLPLEILIKQNSLSGIDIDVLRKLGPDKYLTEYKNTIVEESLNKSLDYREEKEYRAITFAQSSEIEHLDLTIKDSLKAIAYFPNNSLSNDKVENRDFCLSLARNMGIEIIRICPKDNKIPFKTENEWKLEQEKEANSFKMFVAELSN